MGNVYAKYAGVPEDAFEVPPMSKSSRPLIGYTAEDDSLVCMPFALPDNDDWDAPPTKLTAGVIATKAACLVSGERDRQHGEKRANFKRIAALWNAYIDGRAAGELDAVDVGHMMVLLKIARTQSGAHNIDDHVDMVGYAACAGEIAAERRV